MLMFFKSLSRDSRNEELVRVCEQVKEVVGMR